MQADTKPDWRPNLSTYLIAQLTIHDREKYADYENGFLEIFAKYNGKLLSVDEEPECLEGSWNFTRSVLLEFPSDEEAKAWYYSDEYQDLVKHRFAASNRN